jgi:hypothetical protein
MGSSTDMPCQELVELVTAYLDGALSPTDCERCEAHWRTCPACRTYLAQMQLVVGSLGQLGRREVGENGAEKDRLLDLFRTRGFHHRGLRESSVPLGVAGKFTVPGDHISYFWESETEFDAAAGFLAAGVERDEVCVLLGHAVANSRVLAGLERRGLAPDELRRRDRLHTVSGQQPAEAILREIGDRARIAVDRGAPMIRVLGNLGWEHPGWPAEGDILRLEARVTDAIRNLASVVMCAYDVRGVSGRSLLLGGLECHPLTLRRGELRRNQHHVPAEQFLQTLALDAA